MSIPDLQERKRKIHEVFSKADASLHKGIITQEHRDAILRHYYNTTSEREATARIDEQMAELRSPPAHSPTVLVIGFALLMLSLFGVLFYTTGGITGAVILDITPVNATYTSNTSIPITLDGATKVNVSGVTTGEAIISLVHDGVSYRIYQYSSIVSTEHASVSARHPAGDAVTFNAANLSSAYLMTENDAVLLSNTTIEGLAAGEYTLKLIINDTELSQEMLQFTVVEPGTQLIEPFNTCGDACNINLSGNATIEIVTDTEVTIDRIIVTTQQNNPPQFVQEIADASGVGAVNLDLSAAFIDADGDPLLYSSTDHAENVESFEGTDFIVSGSPGTYTYIVYASDMADLTPSNIFSVTILEAMNETPMLNETNTTEINTTDPVLNETPVIPQLNTTINGTINESTSIPNSTNASALGCSDPDPNKRPLECIQNASSTYFRPEEINIENKDAVVVGKLTPIGNLLIKGGIVEYSTGTPGSRDWVRGYEDNNGDFVATVWISSTGDLHLRGSLTEANTNIIFEQGLTALMNDRQIILALMNTRVGDLTVRGNVIPYRRSFE